ncbi:unnamed protein product [Adineta ricciae]|uniref:Uncharacterized protein n=1 Tax=Adineta ricciae TaxID=249248 RepID=A0A814W2P2_ADIRI|nr:unnamed protein product [Adineta ricciae]
MINLLLFLGPEGLKWNTTAITVLDETSLSALGVPSSILIEFRTQILYAVDVGDKRVLKRFSNDEISVAARLANGIRGSTLETL